MAGIPATRIIQQAMEDAGLLQEGQTPNSTQQANYLLRINDIINYTQTLGLALYLIQDVTIPLTVGQGLYTLMVGGDVNMAKPSQVIDGYYSDVNNIQRPLIPLSWNEWIRLSQPSITGQINSWFADKKADRVNIHLWNVPDSNAATGTVHLVVRTQATNLASVSDNIMFAPEWGIYLHWALADEISTGQPEAIQSKCATKRQKYLEDLLAFDTEDASVQFQPDSRGQYPGSDFQ